MANDPSDDKKVAYWFDIICNSATMRDQLDDPRYQVIDFTSDDQGPT